MKKFRLRDALLKNILLLFIGITIIYLILRTLDIKKLVTIFSNVNWYYMLILILMSAFINFVLMPDKWRRILRVLGVKISLKEAAYIHFANFPLSCLLPARLGELFKALHMKKHHKLSFREGTSSLIFDNATDLVVMLFFIMFGLLFLNVKLPVNIFLCLWRPWYPLLFLFVHE